MTVIALLCVDKWGRRKFLLVGAVLMCLSLFILGLVTHYDSGESITDPCEEEMYCVNTTSVSVMLQSSVSSPNIQSTISTTTVMTNYTQTNQTTTTSITLHGAGLGKAMAFTALLTCVTAYGFSFGPGKYMAFTALHTCVAAYRFSF